MMKNVLKTLKKAFIGIPLAIFLYELFNLTISIVLKQYVRIDGGNLKEVIITYIESAITFYGLAFMMYYIDILKKSSEKNEIQMTKSVINTFGIVMILIILIMSIIDNDILFGLITIVMILLLVLVLLFIVFLFDKKEVNNINKKIKEDNKNKF